MNGLTKAIVAGLMVLGAAGCSTWDRMSSSERGAVVGAGVGGVAGSAATGGSTVGTLGGAAVGGVIGHEVGERRR